MIKLLQNNPLSLHRSQKKSLMPHSPQIQHNKSVLLQQLLSNSSLRDGNMHICVMEKIPILSELVMMWSLGVCKFRTSSRLK